VERSDIKQRILEEIRKRTPPTIEPGQKKYTALYWLAIIVAVVILFLIARH
jgi:hypothetical protein